MIASVATGAAGAAAGVALATSHPARLRSIFTANIPLSGGPASLSLDKVADTAYGTSGTLMTYVITVSNNGTGTATGVRVSDPLPDGLQLHDVIPSQGSYDSGSGVWNVGTLAGHTTATLYIEVQITATSGIIINTARLPDGTSASAQTSVA